MRVFKDPARFKVVVAGRRWGKTALSRVWMVSKAARKKKALVWYIAPTYQMARQIMWQELLDSVPRKMIKRLNETTMTMWLRNGSIIALKGADKPDTLRGVGLDAVVMDEFQDQRPETWYTVIQPTLASTNGEVLFIGTPKSYNHLYDLFMDGQSTEHPDWASWQFKTITSPFIPADEIERAKRTMNEKEFRQEFEASFETMSNRVYHAFDRALHVGRVKMNPKYDVLIGMDFNVDPMTAIMFQIIDRKVRIFDELNLANSSTMEMTEQLERLFWRQKRRVVIYPDPAGVQRSTAAAAGESDFAILRQQGFKRLKYRRRHPRQRDRINAVNRMLMSADGTSRVLIDHGCRTLIKSFEQTQYKQGTSEIDKKPHIEHPTDAIGYPIEIEFPVREINVMGVSL
ncbi:MAG: phage terminase large subunit [Mameliella sp.]|nr:phage terminase large subunit [Mameliella sp.]